MIKVYLIIAGALLQIFLGGAHLADFISKLDPARVDPQFKTVIELVADKPLPLPLGASRTYSELQDGFSLMYAVLLLTVGCLNCVAAFACKDHGGVHFGLVMVNLAGMLGVLWASYQYLIIFPGIVAVTAAVVMFFSLFLTNRSPSTGN